MCPLNEHCVYIEVYVTSVNFKYWVNDVFGRLSQYKLHVQAAANEYRKHTYTKNYKTVQTVHIYSRSGRIIVVYRTV